jgi:tetratricopeptide (TPR) repeat protein
MRAALAIVMLGALCVLGGVARADRADQLFKKGKKLLSEKKYAEACTAFEQSDQIDPEIGAKLNVARCYQEWGKLATAWRWYTEAEQMASKAGDDRAKRIHALIADLDHDVPRLRLSLPADAALDGVVIRLDGIELPAAEISQERRVDPGSHRIETIVNGAARSKTIAVERGASDVVLDVPVRSRQRGATSPSPPAPVPELPADRGQTRRLLGLGTAGVGVVVIGIAGIVTLNARSDYQHALDGYCGGATDMCDDTGLSRTHSARHRANIATVVTLAGVAAVAGGVYLYLSGRREPRERTEHALYIAPALGAATGVVLGGAF